MLHIIHTKDLLNTHTFTNCTRLLKLRSKSSVRSPTPVAASPKAQAAAAAERPDPHGTVPPRVQELGSHIGTLYCGDSFGSLALFNDTSHRYACSKAQCTL